MHMIIDKSRIFKKWVCAGESLSGFLKSLVAAIRVLCFAYTVTPARVFPNSSKFLKRNARNREDKSGDLLCQMRIDEEEMGDAVEEHCKHKNT